MPSIVERVDRLETVFASFMERTEEALADIRASTAEIRASTAEIRASNLRTDAILLEMQRQADKDRQQADKDRQQADKDRQQADKDRQQAEKDRQQAEKDRKDFNKRLAELSDSMGTLVEDMVAPNARRIAGEIFPDDPVVRLAQRVRQVHPADRGRMLEIDLLVAGQRNLMVVEAKRRLNPEKIREFAEEIGSIPEFMHEYAGHKLVPVVASVTIEPSVIVFLNRQKVYGVAMGDETMELVNLGQF
ncbi:MAG: cell envelope integrity protein TolA [Verrucomicrobia bacterium]|nr:cell envelope integrity protein TolA [Verrucomicrobiota bacterium]